MKNTPKTPVIIDREKIAWQLGFLASAIGGIPYLDAPPSEDDYCGIMTLLYEIRDKIFPEGALGHDKEGAE